MDSQTLLVGSAILAIFIFFAIVASGDNKKGMVPLYYGPYVAGAAPQVSAWQQTTQGGIPNVIDGIGPNGQPLGAFDYLSQNMSGYNAMPGNLTYSGYTDCGCGCGGAKEANASAAAVQAAAATATPVQNGTVTKTVPKSSVTKATGKTGPAGGLKGFFNDPMDIHNQAMWCHPGSVPGGRSDCPNGQPLGGPSGNYSTAMAAAWNGSASPSGAPTPTNMPAATAGSGLKGFGTRMFGRAPGDALAETAATVNSRRSLNSTYWDQAHKAQALAQNQAADLAIALTKIDLKAADNQNAAVQATLASAAATTTGTDTNRLNAFMDSPLNNPRQKLAGGKLGNFRGANEVSSMDHRSRSVY